MNFELKNEQIGSISTNFATFRLTNLVFQRIFQNYVPQDSFFSLKNAQISISSVPNAEQRLSLRVSTIQTEINLDF